MNNIDLMHARLGVRGGDFQQDRMIRDKRKSLDKALLYSYQGANVRKVDSTEVVKALINPNRTKEDYDDKIISIGFEHGFKPGTVFSWENTNTKWLIYLQDLTELAYFRGDIRKCSYEISWKDENGDVQSTAAAVIGPTVTDLTSITKNKVNIDIPNYDLNIIMPSSEAIVKHFRRYTKFYLKPLTLGDEPTCWRITATDTISMPGILQFSAEEYYINKDKDDPEKGVVDAIVEETPQPQDKEIYGETFIKPKKSYQYIYNGVGQCDWSWDKRLPLDIKVEGNTLTLIWTQTYSGQFVLKGGEFEKTIVVESLF